MTNQITLNENEKILLRKIVGSALHNANHMKMEAETYIPNEKEYSTVCSLYNKTIDMFSK